MKARATIFGNGFVKSGFGERTLGLILGQGAGTVSQAEREASVTQIQAAMAKMDVVNAWSQAHPNPTAADLGADLQAYTDQMGNLGVFASGAAAAYQAMGPPQGPYNVAATDWNSIAGWIAAVNALYDIVGRHQGKPAPLMKTGTPAAASAGLVLGLPAPVVYVGGGLLVVGALFMLFRH